LVDKNTKQEVKNHEALELLKKPNKVQTDSDFIYLMSTYIDLFGQAPIYPLKSALNDKVYAQLQLLCPANMNVYLDMNSVFDKIAKIQYTKNGKMMDVKPNELIDIKRADPFHPWKGLSTIEKARLERENELNSLDLDNMFAKNGAVPSGVVATDKPLRKETFKFVQKNLKREYEGKKNAFKLMFLTHGMKFTPVTMNSKDLEYVAKRKLNREQIMSIFKVPPTLMAITGSSNRATALVEERTFSANVVDPRLDLIYTSLTRFYLPLFKNTENLEFIYDNPIPEDVESEVLEITAGVAGKQWMSINEARKMRNLPSIPGGDKIDDTDSKDPKEDPKPNDEPSSEEKQVNLLEKIIGVKKKRHEKHDCKDHHCKELAPDPTNIKNKKIQALVTARNKYIAFKEVDLADKLSTHFDKFSDIAATKKKDVSNDSLTPQQVEEHLFPKEEVVKWVFALYLILRLNNDETGNAAVSTLTDIFKWIEVDKVDRDLISETRAKTSASSIEKTLLQTVRKEIKKNLDDGITDMRVIRQNVYGMLSDYKDWKIDQVVKTEVSTMWGEIQFREYQKNGVEKIKWLCGADPCPLCLGNKNQIVELGKEFNSGHTKEPAHVNCYCQTIPIV